MHRVEHAQEEAQRVLEGLSEGFAHAPEMRLYTRHEHGNLPVRVYRGEGGQTLYDLTTPSEACPSGRRTQTFTSARGLINSLYGHDVHMPFDRYFRIGRYRRGGRASGQANILTLLDATAPAARHTSISLHSTSMGTRRTSIAWSSQVPRDLPPKSEAEVSEVSGGGSGALDPEIEDFVAAMREDLRPLEEFLRATPRRVEEFERSFALELDRVEGLVGIELGERSSRSGSKTRADEVRRLLWRGFAGKMLSQGYDPEDVLQEVYRGLLVRNGGRCPWDARKSTFGHYVHMVISCVLTNYHRKQVRRIDRDVLPLVGRTKEGEEVELAWGAVEIHQGSEVGDKLALEQLSRHLEEAGDVEPEAVLGRRILPLVASGHQRSEIVRETGEKPTLVSKALAWLRRQAASWAATGGLEAHVPARYLS